jgi:parvulin-like peptidyl-prolyl isomerase
MTKFFGIVGRRFGAHRGAVCALLGAALFNLPACPSLAAEEPPPIAFEAKQVLAKVDSATIVAGDVVLWALAEFNRAKANIPAKDHVAKYREAMRKQVDSLVKIKLLFHDAERNTPAEEFAETTERIENEFDELALDDFLKRTACSTPEELEEKLEPAGSSLERLKRNFVESQIAEQWFRDQVGVKVTREEALHRYQDRPEKYEYPARACFDELVVKISRYRGEDAARKALAEMAARVERGEPWTTVAKARSEGTTSAEGGRQEWINQGSHRSRSVDKALFSLPVGEMSPILKDDRGVSIVRVVEREPAGPIPFNDIEAAIVDEIKRERFAEDHERIEEEQVAYMKRLFAEARPWTIFDDRNAAKNKKQTNLR